MSTPNDLIHRQTATQLTQQWEAAKARISHAMSELAECEALLDNMLGASRGAIKEHLRYGRISFDDPRDLFGFIEGHLWEALFNRTEIWQVLSIAKTEELHSMLRVAQDHYQKAPSQLGPITLENVAGVLLGLRDGLTDYIDDAILEVYTSLRPNEYNRKTYKTNDPQKGVGKRVVLERIVERRDRRWAWTPRVNSDAIPELRAIDRVFHMLDGKGYASKTYGGNLYNAIKQLTPDVLTGETEYFRFTAHQNGNLHLEFRRLDLLRALNQKGGERLLKKGSAQ